MSEALAKKEQAFSLVPTNFEEAMKFAKLLADSDMVPKDYKGKPGNVIVAMQMGLEVGLQPLQALQNIAVINGRAAVWGDAMLALVKTHTSFEWIDEKYNPTLKAAICTVKRKGQPEQVRQFSEDDAKKARLWEKDIWKSYPQRMLQMRARAFALRDVFPDAIKGLAMAEEVQDIQEVDVTPRQEPLVTQPFQVPTMPTVAPKAEASKVEPVAEAPKEEPKPVAAPVAGLVVDAEFTDLGDAQKTLVDYERRISLIANVYESTAWLNKHLKEIAAHPHKEAIMAVYKTRHEVLLMDDHGKEDAKEHEGGTEVNWEAELATAESVEISNSLWTDFEKTNPSGPEKVKMRRVKDGRVAELKKQAGK